MDHNPCDLVLDIGGEGRHAGAWNVNCSLTRTLGKDAGGPIPRLIVARADALPFPDHCVKSLIVERTPVTSASAREMSRVIQADGQILLRHVPLPDRDRHAPALAILGGYAKQRSTTIHGQTVLETTIHFSENESSTWACGSDKST